MSRQKDQPVLKPKGRRLWVRSLLVALNATLAAGALWLGMSIPSYFRSVSPLVLEAAAAGTPGLEEAAADQLQGGRPGLAIPLIDAYRQVSGNEAGAALQRQIDELFAANPAYRWSGGPAPFYEQFLRQAEFLRESETAVIPALLPQQHRAALLGFLKESPNQNVQQILETRTLGDWQRFYPVYSTSGHPLDATLLTIALLEQSSALPEGLRKALLEAVGGALAEEATAMADLEAFAIGILTLGRYANWLELKTLVQRLEAPSQLLFAAQAVQETPTRLPLFFSVVQWTRDPQRVVDYLARHGDRGWSALQAALRMGQGAVGAVLAFDKPVYHPPAFWDALPDSIRSNQQAFKEFAEAWPRLAIGARAAAFALCGFFLVGILRTVILGGQPRPDHQRRILINLDSLVGGVLVMLLVWVLIEPGLLDFRPNEQGTLQINLAQIIPGASSSEPETPSTTMLDQVTILVLILFFVLQLLVFIFGLLKIAEVRKQTLSPDLKLRLLDNEENLFDLGLYVGLGGTVGSLVLVVLNIVDASLMAAYASTLFGIIFVALLKVGFLRPFRRKLILQAK